MTKSRCGGWSLLWVGRRKRKINFISLIPRSKCQRIFDFCSFTRTLRDRNMVNMPCGMAKWSCWKNYKGGLKMQLGFQLSQSHKFHFKAFDICSAVWDSARLAMQTSCWVKNYFLCQVSWRQTFKYDEQIENKFVWNFNPISRWKFHWSVSRRS